jgi:DNA-binding CsgD family transcriptional regulator
MVLTTYQGLRMSTRNAEIAQLVMSGHSYSDIAEKLGMSLHEVTRCCYNLRERGLQIRPQRRFRFIATNEKGEQTIFIGNNDIKNRGGFCRVQVHKAATNGTEYAGFTWVKESL